MEGMRGGDPHRRCARGWGGPAWFDSDTGATAVHKVCAGRDVGLAWGEWVVMCVKGVGK